MKKSILLFGSAPLPGSNAMANAMGIRTEQFLEPLRQVCDVTVFLIENSDVQLAPTGTKTHVVSRQDPQLKKKAQEVVKGGKFDAVVGVNTFPSFLAAQVLDDTTPFWADLNGWVMAEMQAQAYELKHNHYLSHGWQQEETILLRADMVSTVSTPQKYAVIGELGALGRLTGDTFGNTFVHVIPNVAQRKEHSNLQTGDTRADRAQYNIPQDAFVVTQIGGFNNWADEKTLFEALEGEIHRNKNIHFLSTGGSIRHIADGPFARFQERVKKSKHKENFHLLGWIEKAEIPRIYSISDLGIMVDIPCIETETGARNRLNEMMAYGLPILCTRGSEITFDIERWQCGKVVESGNIKELQMSIQALQESDQLREQFSKKALEVCQTLLTNQKTISPVLQWIAQEKHELFHRHRVYLSSGKVKAGLQFLKERGLKECLKKIWQKVHG